MSRKRPIVDWLEERQDQGSESADNDNTNSSNHNQPEVITDEEIETAYRDLGIPLSVLRDHHNQLDKPVA